MVLPDDAQPRFVEVGHHEITVANLPLRSQVGTKPGVESLEQLQHALGESGSGGGVCTCSQRASTAASGGISRNEKRRRKA